MEELNNKEIYWINYYDTTDKNKGYNLCEGGGNTKGYHHTEESKMKMSKNHPRFYGEDNHFYGKTHTEETKKKMSKARKGKPNHQSKDIINLDTGEIFHTAVEACEKYPHIKATHILRVCRGGRKTTGGFRWAFLKDVVNS